MKAILEYSLPEEEKEHLRATKSSDLALALWDIEQYLREIYKWKREYDIETIRNHFYSILADHDINLDNLME